MVSMRFVTRKPPNILIPANNKEIAASRITIKLIVHFRTLSMILHWQLILNWTQENVL